jgi:hypothetical protein
MCTVVDKPNSGGLFEAWSSLGQAVSMRLVLNVAAKLALQFFA